MPRTGMILSVSRVASQVATLGRSLIGVGHRAMGTLALNRRQKEAHTKVIHHLVTNMVLAAAKNRRSTRLIVIIAAVALVAGVAIYILRYYPIGGVPRVFCERASADGRFLVAGECHVPLPLGGWSMALYWKRPRQPWAAYYLDHEAPFWRDVEIVREGDHVYVKRAGQVEGDLNLKDYSFRNYHQNYTHTKPMFVILDGNPFSANQHRILYPDTVGYTSAWPVMVEGSIPDNWQAKVKR